MWSNPWLDFLKFHHLQQRHFTTFFIHAFLFTWFLVSFLFSYKPNDAPITTTTTTNSLPLVQRIHIISNDANTQNYVTYCKIHRNAFNCWHFSKIGAKIVTNKLKWMLLTWFQWLYTMSQTTRAKNTNRRCMCFTMTGKCNQLCVASSYWIRCSREFLFLSLQYTTYLTWMPPFAASFPLSSSSASLNVNSFCLGMCGSECRWYAVRSMPVSAGWFRFSP